MRFAVLALFLLAYPATMVNPPECQGAGCMVNPDGSCMYPMSPMGCGTFNRQGVCMTLDGRKPGTYRCVCVR